eukprot:jgi/Botrbrau1/10434/Bobra.0133s0041.1
MQRRCINMRAWDAPMWGREDVKGTHWKSKTKAADVGASRCTDVQKLYHREPTRDVTMGVLRCGRGSNHSFSFTSSHPPSRCESLRGGRCSGT